MLKILKHSIKAHADGATLIYDCLETHTKVLKQVDQKALNLDLLFKLSKYVSYLFDRESSYLEASLINCWEIT